MSILNIGSLSNGKLSDVLNRCCVGLLRVSGLEKVLIGYCVSDMVMFQSALSEYISRDILGVKVLNMGSNYIISAQLSEEKVIELGYNSDRCEYVCKSSCGYNKKELLERFKGYVYNIVRKHGLYFDGIPCVVLNSGGDQPSVVAYVYKSKVRLLKFVLNHKMEKEVYDLELIGVENSDSLYNIW